MGYGSDTCYTYEYRVITTEGSNAKNLSTDLVGSLAMEVWYYHVGNRQDGQGRLSPEAMEQTPPPPVKI